MPRADWRFIRLIFLAASSNAGVQFVNSIQYSLAAPLFQSQYHLASSFTALIIALAGPLSGIVLQPLVGGWSDRYRSRWGKRRPFIAIGSVFCALGMLLVAFSVQLGTAFGDKVAWGLPLAIVGFLLTNIFANVVAGPARAVVADLSTDARLQLANSLVTTSMMVSAIVAPLIGAQLFYTDQPYQWLFMMGAIVMLVSGIVTLAFADERSTADEAPATMNVEQDFLVVFMWRGLRAMPRSLLRVLAAFFSSWCAFAPFWILYSLWWGRNVFPGTLTGYGEVTDTAAFSEGVHISLYNLASFAAVSFLFSLALPSMVTALGVKVIWANAQVLACVCYGLFLYVTNIGPGFLICAGISFSFCVFNSVPFALISIYSEKARTGFYVGIFNASSNFAQVIFYLAASGLLALVNQNVAWAIALGAPVGVVALGFVLFLPNTDAEKAAMLRHQMEKTRINFKPSASEDDGSESGGDVTDSDTADESQRLIPRPASQPSSRSGSPAIFK